MPATVTFGSTFFKTRLPAAIVEFSPIKTIRAYDFISANLIYDLIGVIESNSNT